MAQTAGPIRDCEGCPSAGSLTVLPEDEYKSFVPARMRSVRVARFFCLLREVISMLFD